MQLTPHSLHCCDMLAPLLPDSVQCASNAQRQAVTTVSSVTGKAMVYTAAAGVFPHQVIPIQLDVGCNTPEVRDNPLYMGLQQVGTRTSASKPTITNFSKIPTFWPPTAVPNLQACEFLMPAHLHICVYCHQACTTSSVADHGSVSNTDSISACSAIPHVWSHCSSRCSRLDLCSATCYADRTIA